MTARESEASDRIWPLVEGFRKEERANTLFFMLRAYFDDSDIGSGPVFTLAGFVAPAEKWARFADEWQRILDMSPKIRYFKQAEAMNFTGEFAGISEQSRDEKITILLGLIEEFGLVGISAAMPRSLYEHWFEGDSDRRLRDPYFLLFFRVITRLVRFCKKYGINEKIDFVFDNQPGHITRVMAAWEDFVSKAPAEFRDYLGDPPIFRDDKTTLPLQAADFNVGFLRTIITSALAGTPRPPSPWQSIRKYGADDAILQQMTIMRWEDAESAFVDVHGYSRWSYGFAASSKLMI